MLNGLFGKIKFFVEGLNHARLIEKLRKTARLFDVKSNAKSLIFWCAKKDKDKIIAKLNELCYNFTILEEKGLSFALKHTVARAGVILGVALSVILTVLYPKLVLYISVNDEGLRDQTISVLQEAGVSQNKLIWTIDAEGISKRLMALDGVSYAKVTRRGTSVEVELRRELLPPEFLFESGKKVVSVRTAVVTRAVVFSGTAVVKYGDVVKPGDTLIDSYFTVRDERMPTVASGEVYGKVYIQNSVYFAKSEWSGEIGRKEQQEKTAQLLTEAKLTQGEIVTDKWFTHRETSDGYIVTVKLECEVKISG